MEPFGTVDVLAYDRDEAARIASGFAHRGKVWDGTGLKCELESDEDKKAEMSELLRRNPGLGMMRVPFRRNVTTSSWTRDLRIPISGISDVSRFVDPERDELFPGL